MWTSSESNRAPRPWALPVIAAIVLASAPAAAISGVREATADKLRAEGPAADRRPASSGYLLRCWQYGRLILEEQHLSTPDGDDMKAARLRLTDRANKPIYLADTANATCLVRPSAAERERSSRD